MPDDYKYWAFISYSHQDKAWGDWLHKALEAYQVPKRVVGQTSRDGYVPERLFPVFRDREELPGPSSLTDNINHALRESRYLIVICSPRSATSHWVNEEVKAFKEMGREDRILCMIVEGEPNATDKVDSMMFECFAPALRFRFGADGQPTRQRVEPIAADAREDKDGKTNALLKLIAGLLGVGYDELRQRDRERQKRERLRNSLAVVALLVAIAAVIAWATDSKFAPLAGTTLALIGIAIWQWQEREKLNQWKIQEEQKAEQSRLDKIAAYTELGRQEVLQGKLLRAAVYLGEAYRLGGNDLPLRFLLRQSMHAVDAEEAVLRGHEADVYIAEFSPDGQRILTADMEGGAIVWDVAAHQRLFVLRHPRGAILSAQFSPDGAYIATGDGFGVIAIWDGSTGRLQASIETGDECRVYSIRFSPDGKNIVTASYPEHSAKIRRISDGKLLTKLGGSSAVYFAAYDPAGSRVVTAHEDGIARIWEAMDGALLVELKGHDRELVSALFSPDGTRVLTVARGSVAKLWDSSTGSEMFMLNGARGGNFSPDGSKVVAPGYFDEGQIARIWSAVDGKAQTELIAGRVGTVVSASFSSDGRYVVTGATGARGGVSVWDAANGRLMLDFDVRMRIFGFLLPVLCPAPQFNVSMTRIVTGTGGKAARLWNLKSGLLPTRMSSPCAGITDISFSPDGGRIVSASEDGTARIWDTDSGAVLQTLDHSILVYQAIFSPDGSRIVTVTKDKSVRLWNALNGALFLEMGGNHESVPRARFSRDGRRLIVMSKKCLRVHDAVNGAVILVREDDRCETISPDGSRALTGSYTMSVRDTSNGEPLCAFETRIIFTDLWATTFSNDGNYVAILGEESEKTSDGPVKTGVSFKLWDAESGELRCTLVEKDDLATNDNLSFNGAGTRLATGRDDGTVKVWDTKDGALLSWFEAHEGRKVGQVEFGPNGKLLLTTDGEDSTRIWDAESGRLLRSYDEAGISTFSPDGKCIATVGRNLGIQVWRVGAEERELSNIAALVDARVPWRLDGGKLIPKPLEVSSV